MPSTVPRLYTVFFHTVWRVACNACNATFSPQPIPRHTTTTTLFKAWPQHHNTEPQLSTPSLFFPLQESLHAQLQTLLAQHILALRQHASLQRPLPPPIQLP